MTSSVIERLHTRPWQDSDFADAVVLNREAEEHIGIGSESGDWARDMEGITETFEGSGGEFLVSHLDEKMVAMGGFKLHTPTIAEVKRMRVSPELQGKRIGPWFLGLLEADMRNAGITDSVVSTLSVQEAALKLYSRAGYTEVKREELTEGPEKGFVVVSFVKNLAS
ncbi:MAG: GNAT family N-acetyltransferase [Candidatus Saccharimonadales bacterium]